MILQERDLSFNFTDALDAVVFDDAVCHGLSHCMKAVDFVVEFDSATLFVEVKDPSDSRARVEAQEAFERSLGSGGLQNKLVAKYRDSFLYRWAGDKVDKPHHYLCLITLEDALLVPFADRLKQQLPAGSASASWTQPLAHSVHVVSLDAWNRNFPKWPVHRVSEITTAEAAEE